MSGLEGFGTGFRSYVQAQGMLVNNTNLTDETGKVLNPATPEEIKY
ncbi:cytochrome C551 [Escherichia coli]|nr:cytochrome C551 [Escherichia coli]